MTIRQKVNVVTLCSGYGAQEMAFDRLKHDYPNFDWNLLAWSEIEPNAILAHKACHPEYAERNLGDMTTCDYSKITEPVDVLFYSTPCQSVSLAGRRKGMKEGSDAASALIWHTRRSIESLKPRICILENVKGMVSGENLRDFHKWQNTMAEYGYTNFAQILNSKDYGIPQNRERLFMVSIWGGQSYNFPMPFKLQKRIKDILEPYGTVDESFYFSAERLVAMLTYCERKVEEGCGFKTNFKTGDSIATCVTSRYGAEYTNTYFREPFPIQRASLYDNNAQAGRIYDVDGIAPTLKCYTGGNSEPKILEPCILGYTRSSDGKSKKYHDKQLANTLHQSTGSAGNTDQFVKEPISCSFDNLPDKTVLQDEDGRGYLWQDGALWRVRKLTPREVFRLQDVSDEDIDKILAAGISKTACYTLAGNSITVAPLYHIFRKLFIDTTNESQQPSLFDF